MRFLCKPTNVVLLILFPDGESKAGQGEAAPRRSWASQRRAGKASFPAGRWSQAGQWGPGEQHIILNILGLDGLSWFGSLFFFSSDGSCEILGIIAQTRLESFWPLVERACWNTRENWSAITAICFLYLVHSAFFRQRGKKGSNPGAETGRKGHGALATEGANSIFGWCLCPTLNKCVSLLCGGERQEGS